MNPTVAGTSRSLTLACGPLRCEIDPALGGSIAGLWWRDLPALRPAPSDGPRDVRLSSSYPLVPYSNRVGLARLIWQGVEHSLVPNFAPEPHAIHGVGWRRHWKVVQADGSMARLRLNHTPDADWPFAFEAQQEMHLRSDALELSMQITNRDVRPMPAGLGWHPYFVKRAGSRLRFAATGRWEMGEDRLPTVRLPMAGLQVDCGTLQVDHCFDAWTGRVELEDDRLRIRVESDLPNLVVFTDPSREFIAIEPVSHVNNALQLAARLGMAPAGLGIRSLSYGESMSAWMRITVQAC
jgi:aldose 1-epimerase